MLGLWLDLMILGIFSNLNNSMILLLVLCPSACCLSKSNTFPITQASTYISLQLRSGKVSSCLYWVLKEPASTVCSLAYIYIQCKVQEKFWVIL